MITTLDLPLARPSERLQGPGAADPLGFLAGRRYTCYCGRSLEGTMLCPSCAEEMLDRLVGRQAGVLARNLQKLARTDH